MGRTLLLISLILSAAVPSAARITTPEQHIRGGDQTYLTFPEWFLVHSPTEYANYLATEPPSQFPYSAHIGQLWSSYGAVYNRVKEEFPFNGEYHTMIMVIGVSTTAEYGVKGAYEVTVGRVSEATRTHGMTEEDVVAYLEAKRYADFILVRPWYEFDYLGSLANLWVNTSFFGPDMTRKLERKYFLSTEYLIKAFYAWLIELATAASFDAPIHQTAVITSRDELVFLPRYRPFTQAAVDAALTGTDFVEIAGNRDKILVSLWAPPDWSPSSIGAETLFTQPIITVSGQDRYVLEIPISNLGTSLRNISSQNITLEHIYDF